MKEEGRGGRDEGRGGNEEGRGGRERGREGRREGGKKGGIRRVYLSLPFLLSSSVPGDAVQQRHVHCALISVLRLLIIH